MWETKVWSLALEDPWRRAWQSTPVFLPRESHGQRSLAGYVLGVAYSWTQLRPCSSQQKYLHPASKWGKREEGWFYRAFCGWACRWCPWLLHSFHGLELSHRLRLTAGETSSVSAVCPGGKKDSKFTDHLKAFLRTHHKWFDHSLPCEPSPNDLFPMVGCRRFCISIEEKQSSLLWWVCFVFSFHWFYFWCM